MTTRYLLGYPYANSDPENIRHAAVTLFPSPYPGYGTIVGADEESLSLVETDRGPLILQGVNHRGVRGKLLEQDEPSQRSIARHGRIIGQGTSMQLALVLAVFAQYPNDTSSLPLVLFSGSIQSPTGARPFVDATIDVYCTAEEAQYSLSQKYQAAKIAGAQALVLPKRDGDILAQSLQRECQPLDKLNHLVPQEVAIIGLEPNQLPPLAEVLGISPLHYRAPQSPLESLKSNLTKIHGLVLTALALILVALFIWQPWNKPKAASPPEKTTPPNSTATKKKKTQEFLKMVAQRLDGELWKKGQGSGALGLEEEVQKFAKSGQIDYPTLKSILQNPTLEDEMIPLSALYLAYVLGENGKELTQSLPEVWPKKPAWHSAISLVLAKTQPVKWLKSQVEGDEGFAISFWQGLGRIRKPPRGIESKILPLVPLALGQKNPQIYLPAFRLLRWFGPRAAPIIPVLIKMLHHKIMYQRGLAAHTLAEMGPVVWPYLFPSPQSSHPTYYLEEIERLWRELAPLPLSFIERGIAYFSSKPLILANLLAPGEEKRLLKTLEVLPVLEKKEQQLVVMEVLHSHLKAPSPSLAFLLNSKPYMQQKLAHTLDLLWQKNPPQPHKILILKLWRLYPSPSYRPQVLQLLSSSSLPTPLAQEALRTLHHMNNGKKEEFSLWKPWLYREKTYPQAVSLLGQIFQKDIGFLKKLLQEKSLSSKLAALEVMAMGKEAIPEVLPTLVGMTRQAKISPELKGQVLVTLIYTHPAKEYYSLLAPLLSKVKSSRLRHHMLQALAHGQEHGAKPLQDFFQIASGEDKVLAGHYLMKVKNHAPNSYEKVAKYLQTVALNQAHPQWEKSVVALAAHPEQALKIASYLVKNKNRLAAQQALSHLIGQGIDWKDARQRQWIMDLISDVGERWPGPLDHKALRTFEKALQGLAQQTSLPKKTPLLKEMEKRLGRYREAVVWMGLFSFGGKTAYQKYNFSIRRLARGASQWQVRLHATRLVEKHGKKRP